MKRKTIIISIVVFAVVALVGGMQFVPGGEEEYCFGDVCPANGGAAVFYEFRFPFLCELLGGEKIVGNSGWGEDVYAGCAVKGTNKSYYDRYGFGD